MADQPRIAHEAFDRLVGIARTPRRIELVEHRLEAGHFAFTTLCLSPRERPAATSATNTGRRTSLQLFGVLGVGSLASSAAAPCWCGRVEDCREGWIMPSAAPYFPFPGHFVLPPRDG